MARDPLTQFQRSLQGLRRLKRGRVRPAAAHAARAEHVNTIARPQKRDKSEPNQVKPPKVFKNKMLDKINLDWEPEL